MGDDVAVESRRRSLDFQKLLPKFKRKAQEEEGKNATGFQQDPQGRMKGLEDPNDPVLIDDPAIFDSPPTTSSRSPTMILSSTPRFLRGIVDNPTSVPANQGQPFVDPKVYGGSFLNKATTKTDPILGEPLNVIISALSSPSILTAKGLQGYLRSLNLDFECFGLHSGGPQQAFIDSRGFMDQRFLYREVFTPLDHVFGTCIESLRGGNHIRAWQQKETGAWFLAASKEEDVMEKHTIVPNGYNIGRDFLAKQVQRQPLNITDFMFKTYQTKLEYIEGLLPPGAANVNHNISQDGRVLLMTVKLISSAKDKAVLASRRQEMIKPSNLPAKKAAQVKPDGGVKKGRLVVPPLFVRG